MTDQQATLIYAALNVTVMFVGMRLLYGAWPWEYRKTWYATKPRLTPPSTEWMQRDPLEQVIMPVPTPADLKLGADEVSDAFRRTEESGDSFERP